MLVLVLALAAQEFRRKSAYLRRLSLTVWVLRPLGAQRKPSSRKDLLAPLLLLLLFRLRSLLPPFP